MMNKQYSLLLFILSFWALICTQTTAQSVTANIDKWDSLPRLKTPYQQKLYLHFDKPYYAAGERMWFRAYLLDANKFTQDTTNTPIYVELINSQDSIVSRKKIQCLGGAYYGSFLLKELIPEGVYRVRAYTNWMQNSSPDYFYYRQFFIGNSLSSQIKSEIKYLFQTEKKGMAQIQFIQNNAPFAGKEITYYIDRGKKKIKKKTEVTTYDGLVFIKYKAHKIKGKRPTITVEYIDSTNIYTRTYTVPKKNEYDVQLFPEGGEIIAGMTNTVAYKAIGSDGLGVDVKGALFDSDGKRISKFRSVHLGMGKFSFYPDDSHRYYVIVRTRRGEEKRIDLPVTKKEGYALAAVQKYNFILVNVKSVKGRMVDDGLRLMAHIRGKVFYNETISGFTPAVMFDTKKIDGSGIAHFVLLDKNGERISERLVFIRQKEYNQIWIDYYNPVNTKREKVNCVLNVRDAHGKPVENGTFSVAITDAAVVGNDTLSGDIYSNLLLTSDLKGYIEKPALYFNPKYEYASDGLDLLMMTQGWRRFDVAKAAKGEINIPEYDMEQSYEVSGQINQDGDATMPLSDLQVNIFAPTINYFNSTQTNSEGYFFFKNLAFPENTSFTLQARGDNISENLKINLQPPMLPEVKESFFPDAGVTPITDTYLLAANDKYFTENGTRSIRSRTKGLLAYTPEKPEEETLDPKYQYSDEEYVIEGKQLETMEGENLSELLRNIPSLDGWQAPANIYNEETTQTDKINGLRFSIDGNIYSYQELKDIDVKKLESVQVLKPFKTETSLDELSNTMVALVFKDENPVSELTDKQKVATTIPVGYSSNILFYEPKYEYFSIRNKPLPDIRSTITFVPEVKTGPTGKALFSFYMADKLTVYNIVVEGLSADGVPCRHEKKRMLFYKTAVHTIE